MLKRILILSGIAAVVLYVLTVAAGGMITPGYRHLSQAISELIQSGAPHQASLEFWFNIYNLLLLFMCVGLLLHFQDSPGIVKAGLVLIGTGSLMGIAMGFFPMDPAGSPMTSAGLIHIILAALSSLLSMAALLMTGLGLSRRTGWSWFRPYTWISFAVVLLSGGLSPVMLALNIPFTGLAERLTIGAYLQWLAVLSCTASRDAAHQA